MAASRGRFGDATQALELGADIDRAHESRHEGYRLFTALMYASERGDAKLARFLLERGADVRVRAGGRTALSSAARANRPRLVRLLVEHGARVNRRLRGGATPLSTASQCDQLPMARLLIELGAKVKPEVLEFARSEAMRTLLVEEPISCADLPRVDRDLLLAALRGQRREVERLLGRGANPDAVDTQKKGALHHAITRGHLQIMRILEVASVQRLKIPAADRDLLVAALEDAPGDVDRALAEGADVEATNRWGNTALDLAATFDCTAAAERLLDGGADLEGGSEGFTPLVWACWTGQAEVARLLLERGANPNPRSHGLNQALVQACSREDPAVLRVLLTSGVDVRGSSETHHEAARYAISPESRRILALAHAGELSANPPAKQHDRADCPTCRTLPDKIIYDSDDDNKTPLPKVVRQRLTIFGRRSANLRKCPLCDTYYRYVYEYDAGWGESSVYEALIRTDPPGALRELEEQVAWWQRRDEVAVPPRIAREITELKRRIRERT